MQHRVPLMLPLTDMARQQFGRGRSDLPCSAVVLQKTRVSKDTNEADGGPAFRLRGG